YENIEETITKSGNSLREDLEAEIVAYGDINIKEIQEFFDLELYFREKELIFDFEELVSQDGAAIELGELRNSLQKIKSVFTSNTTQKLFELLVANPKSIKTLADSEGFLQFLTLALESVQKV